MLALHFLFCILHGRWILDKSWQLDRVALETLFTWPGVLCRQAGEKRKAEVLEQEHRNLQGRNNLVKVRIMLCLN